MKTFKKLFAFSAIFALLATMMPMHVNAATYSEELAEAYAYAKSKGITTMSTIDNADMYGNLTRIAMAKMVSNYVLDLELQDLDTSKDCTFPDVSEALDAQYDNGVTKACQLGLMGVGIDKFNPNGVVTRAEFGTVLSRALWGEENNGSDPYYKAHLEALKEAGIMTKIDEPNAKEVRGYVMIMMQRADDTYTPTGCSAEEVLACLVSDDIDACLAACGTDNDEDVIVKSGDIALSVADYSSDIKSIPALGISIFNSIKFSSTEPVTVNSITLERLGLSEIKAVRNVWFEKNGIAVSSKGVVTTDGKAMVNFIRGFNVKSNDTLDLVVDMSGSVGAEIAFKVIGLDSTAKIANYNIVTSTYRTANYGVADIKFKKSGSDITNKLGTNTSFVIGEFAVENYTASNKEDRQINVKAVTFRNGGTADMENLLKNVVVLRDNKVVSKSYVVNGRNISFVLDDTIDAGRKAMYTIKTEVNFLERENDTVQLELRKEGDLVAYESNTRFRASVSSSSSDGNLASYKFVGGRIILKNTLGFPKVVEAGTGASEVLIADGTITLTEPVMLPKMKFEADGTGARSLMLEIGGIRYVGEKALDNKTFTFDDIYLNKTSSVKLLVSLESTISVSEISFNTGVFGTDVTFGTNKGEYLNNQESLNVSDIAGSIQIAKIMVKEPKFSLKNTATTTQTLVKGMSETKVIFDGTMSAKSDINVTEMTLTSIDSISAGSIDLLLYVNDKVVSNATISTGTSVKLDSIGMVGKESVSVRIEALPTALGTGKYSFKVEAKGVDTLGNTATSSIANTVALNVVSVASLSVTNASTTSSVVEEAASAQLTNFKIVVKDGALAITGIDITVDGTNVLTVDGTNVLSGKSVLLEMSEIDESYDTVVAGDTINFTGLNINLMPGTYEVALLANINTDSNSTGLAVKLTSGNVHYDGTSKSFTLGANYLFVKGYPTLVKTGDVKNKLSVEIKNVSKEVMQITGFTATNVALASINGQSISTGGVIDVAKIPTLSKGESVVLELTVEVGKTLELKGLTYSIDTFTYTITDAYTNIARWGDLSVVYSSN